MRVQESQTDEEQRTLKLVLLYLISALVVSCHRQTAEAERNVWFVRQQLQTSIRVFNGICAGVDFTGGWRCCCCSCFSSSTVRNSLKSECRLFSLRLIIVTDMITFITRFVRSLETWKSWRFWRKDGNVAHRSMYEEVCGWYWCVTLSVWVWLTHPADLHILKQR